MRRRLHSPLRGLWHLALFRRRGVDDFGGDRDAFLVSLAPFVALAIVAAAIGALAGQPREGLAGLLRQVSVLLVPAVLAELACRLWQRPGLWLRYATIANWSIWLQLFLISLLFTVLRAAQLGLVPAVFAVILTLAGCVYMLAFQWFTARVALQLSHARVALLLALNVAIMTALSLYGLSPQALHQAMQIPQP